MTLHEKIIQKKCKIKLFRKMYYLQDNQFLIEIFLYEI